MEDTSISDKASGPICVHIGQLLALQAGRPPAPIWLFNEHGQEDTITSFSLANANAMRLRQFRLLVRCLTHYETIVDDLRQGILLPWADNL